MLYCHLKNISCSFTEKINLCFSYFKMKPIFELLKQTEWGMSETSECKYSYERAINAFSLCCTY